VLGERLLVGFGHDRVDQEQHLHIIGIAAGGGGMAAHVVAIRLHPLDARRTAMTESACFAANARPRGDPPACTKTGLPSAATARVQRTAAPEVLALEVDRPDLGIIGVGTGLGILHHRVRSHESHSLQTRSTYSSAIS
jgi:hypothetical protein